MARRMNTAQVQRQTKSETIEWDNLMLRTVREQFGNRARIVPSLINQQGKNSFVSTLFKDARNINPRDPIEISKNIVDVNEKIYCNAEGGEDSSTVKIVNSVENTEGHNYQESVTKGVQWGANTNVGLQFGLPQVGVSASAGFGLNFQRQRSTTLVNEQKKENRVELQSHHEETVKIAPGKKVIVRMTSYRVRYKLDYTMEYKIAKINRIRVLVDTCGAGLPFCKSYVSVSAQQLLQYLPGYCEDEEFVYFTQEGELRWIADRMDVKKTITNM
ncbi:hypothetical protein GBAR_LOCUS24297 [Geodia barretti]|uniref:Uncharacterized protein n=1 Tax=Geodia barretti TaxID=519541 RepID=A0AA35T8M0_GEOBA|nr:hypothetical protein GBAR_LOCUS24297 [Geodia barretti]